MTDAQQNQPPAGQQQQGQPAGTSLPPSHEQLAQLAPFQHQLTWVGSQEFARGQAQGAKTIAEQLGMSVEEAVSKLKGQAPASASSQGTGQQGQNQNQQGQGQQSDPALERRIAELEQRQTTLDQRETQLSERETAIKAAEQDTLRVTALQALGLDGNQALALKAMLQLPAGVTEMTPELAKASAEQLKTMFPALFPEQNGNGDQQAPAGQPASTQPTDGPPPNTHTPGTQAAASGSGGGVSAGDRAKARLQSRGHVKPPAS